MGPGDEDSKKVMDQVPYRSYTGSLNYFRMTRPDLAVASSICSQFNKSWGPEHVRAVKQTLRHAGPTKHWGIGIAKSGKTLKDDWVIEVWVDASHASCPNTRRSRTGFFVTLNGNLISYKSQWISKICWTSKGTPFELSLNHETQTLIPKT